MSSITGIEPDTVGNRLLRKLRSRDLAALCHQMDRVPLPVGTTICRPDTVIGHVLFPERGIISMIASLNDGSQIEVGMVGGEGMVGLSLLFGEDTTTLGALVQLEGAALRLPEAALRATLAQSPSLGSVLFRYVDSFTSQVSQTAACNGRHWLEQRLARWILMTHDRAGADHFVMTQEFISVMLGVRRPGVTQAIGGLQRSGLVRHERGTLHVLDRVGLEGVACECYAVVERRYAWLRSDRTQNGAGVRFRTASGVNGH